VVADAGLDKLQKVLLAMTPGDVLSAARASQISGLDEAHCDVILTRLMRAGLLIRLQHDVYYRCGLGRAESGPT